MTLPLPILVDVRNDAPSIEGYILTHRMIDELERIWKEAVVA